MSSRIVVMLFVCFGALSSNVADSQEQSITYIEVTEQIAFAPLLGIPADPTKVLVGQCDFIRSNPTWLTYKSWVEAYWEPVFEYEKFPKYLQHDSDSGASIDHPVEIIDKSRVGTAMFYFQEDIEFLDPPDPLYYPLPTDEFEMTISAAKASVKLKKNYTNRVSPETKADHTSYHLQLRLDGPNKTTRAEPIDLNHRYRLALYSKKPDDTWVGPLERVVKSQSVVFDLYHVQFPHSHVDDKGKYTIKGVIEVSDWVIVGDGHPGAPGHWSAWEKMPGSSEFKEELGKEKGKEHEQEQNNNGIGGDGNVN